MNEDLRLQNEVIELKMNEGDTASTKEIASWLGVKTPEAYNVCIELEKAGVLVKFGYKTRFGWEDVEHSSLQTNSLHWQKCVRDE